MGRCRNNCNRCCGRCNNYPYNSGYGNCGFGGCGFGNSWFLLPLLFLCF